MPADTLHPPACFCDDCAADDDDGFVYDFLDDVAGIALARTPAAPKPTSTSSLVAVHFDCRKGCDSPTGCRGGDG